MSDLKAKGEETRQFILENVDKHPGDIGTITARHFGISRQAVNKHIQRLIDSRVLEKKDSGRKSTYSLKDIIVSRITKEIKHIQGEDIIWEQEIKPLLVKLELPNNVMEIWAYGFNEILNNVLDHSAGEFATIKIEANQLETRIRIKDDGKGIFHKIQKALDLLDERHAALELVKGKLTTDPQRHSGEGIFFTSRIFDEFYILSGHTFLSHAFDSDQDWIIDTELETKGTTVNLVLKNKSTRTSKDVFDVFSTGEDYAFNKTNIPVHLAQYGDEQLISRSQAKRLLARFNCFKTVVLDFTKVESIGQAFADEVFRVFSNEYPEVELKVINASDAVQRMIMRAMSLKKEQTTKTEE